MASMSQPRYYMGRNLKDMCHSFNNFINMMATVHHIWLVNFGI